MPSVYDLKPRFQALLRPSCIWLAEKGITANQVTGAALLLSFVHGYWIASSGGSVASLLLLPVTLFLRMALNAVDGMLAREHGMKSRFGALFNELSDVASDAALYLPFALIAGIDGIKIVLIVMLAALVEMTGVLGPTIGASRRYDGPFGKSDRAAFFGVVAVLIGIGVPPTYWIDAALWIALALSLWTIWNRTHRALAEGEE